MRQLQAALMEQALLLSCGPNLAHEQNQPVPVGAAPKRCLSNPASAMSTFSQAAEQRTTSIFVARQPSLKMVRAAA